MAAMKIKAGLKFNESPWPQDFFCAVTALGFFLLQHKINSPPQCQFATH